MNKDTKAETDSQKFTKGIKSVSFFIFLSRITGLLREISLAYFMGASKITDALFLGWTIPNTLRRFFAEGLVAPAFVPAFVEAHKNSQTYQAVSSISGQILLLTSIISIAIISSSYFLPYILAPGFDQEGKRLSSYFIAVLSPYIIFISLATTLSALLNSFKIFGIPEMTMSIFNLSTVLCISAFAILGGRPEIGFISGVFIGVILQILIQFNSSRKLTKLGISFRKNNYSQKIWSAIPAVVTGGAVYQINLLVSRAIASIGGEKVVSYLNYASRFFELPLGIFVYSMSYVSLPFLAEGGKKREFGFSQAIFLSTAITLPATFGLFFLSKPIIFVTFGYGKFSIYDVIETASALAMYSIGLLPVALSRVLTVDFQATGKLKVPVISSIVTFVINTLLCLILVGKFKHSGIALASSISSFIGFIPLVAYSDKKRILLVRFLKGAILSLPASLFAVISGIIFSRYYLELYKILSFVILILIVLLTFLLLLIFVKPWKDHSNS